MPRFNDPVYAPNYHVTGSIYTDFLTSGLYLRLGASAPDLAEFRDGLFLNAFAGTGAVVEQGFFAVHILHDIKPGTFPTFHVHWSHNQAVPSGDVKWQIDYSISKGYSAGIFGSPTTLTAIQTAGVQYDHLITDDDDMIITEDLEPDTVLVCRLYRDPADAEDTFEADASLVQIDMHYEIGQIGTSKRNRPYDRF